LFLFFIYICCTWFKYGFHKLFLIAEIRTTTFNSIRIEFTATGEAFQRLAMQLVSLIEATVQRNRPIQLSMRMCVFRCVCLCVCALY